MFEVKRFAPLFAVLAFGAAVSACDEVPREQQSEAPAQLEQVPDNQQPQDPSVPTQ